MKFRAVVADPPWTFKDQGSRIAPGYRLMSLDDIATLPVAEVCADDALLFLWVPSALLEEGLCVVSAWGFAFKATSVWCKVTKDGRPHIGMGHYFRNAHELVLIGARGKPSKLVQDRSLPSWFSAPRGRHSQKPETFQDLVEGLMEGPYLELFARREREGWTCLGDQIQS